MPQLGETVTEGKITVWFKAVGDSIKPGENLFEIETDKTSMEVPATSAGTLAEIRVAAGAVAPVGAVVAVIAGSGAASASTPQEAQPLIPAKAGLQSQALAPRVRGDEQQSNQVSTPRAPIQMDPWREVKTPERNFGPARLASGATATPLARRLAGR